MSTCTSEDQNVLQVNQNAETDKGKNDSQGEESTENLSNDQAENCNGSPKETFIEEVKAKTLTEVEETTEDQKNENEKTTSGEEIGDEKKIIEDKNLQSEEETGSEEVKAKEGQELEGEGDEGKQDREAASAAVPRIQGGGSQVGQKESPTAYSDVIEETASKLLEKRKNKVRALVGAFETVIDHRSGGSK